MQIVCPNCQFKRKIHASQMPANTTHATCPKCSERFTIAQNVDDNDIIPNNYNDVHQNSAKDHDDSYTSRQNEDHRQEKNDKEDQDELRQRAHASYKEEYERLNKKINKALQIDELDQNGQNIQYITMVPWEMPGNQISLFKKFSLTLTRILTSAPLFFATMLKNYPMQKALLFYVIIGLIQFIAKMLVFQFSAADLVSDTPEIQAFYDVLKDPNTILIGLAISPAILVAQALIVSLILFLTVKIIQPQSAHFPLIVRIVCYCSAVGIVSIVPVIGDFIYIPWMIFNFILACRYALHMSVIKASLTVLAFALFSFGLLLTILPIF